MAKAKATVAEAAKVTIKDLCEEYKVEAKDVRALLRANGFKAPEVTREPGVFGPKAKYEWAADSPELAKVRKVIESTLEDDEAENDDSEETEVEEKPKKPTKKPTKK